ncbi:MAG TPA: hypothetical protein VJA82_11305 [Sediminibacterium sp.]|uniref:hypothetical protein n=1 Tax=Sediminibacterium sp. TaxID=1917865 RepID=UPI0008BAC633|nr:hypothetical protein [Sediminibacterium sp.]OHC84273.1 MAG: hypothetical protein A2472_12500 [Sphingobacteriia bacterium RIFOXYC2_FULL_35_18]OHC88777.1 MAG: hypothetical protein A2546_02685 [Sphingobacteriia bacterium RIFOXYD2_FULL_35_12]HLD53884.1 hypothetical protein [Sediminibacterium sp.]
MIKDIRYSRFDGRAVEVGFSTQQIENIQKVLEIFEDDFKQSNGHIDAFIKDDLGNISITIECENPDLKEQMYQALKPFVR